MTAAMTQVPVPTATESYGLSFGMSVKDIIEETLKGFEASVK